MVPDVPPRADLETPIKLSVRVVRSNPAGPAPQAYPDRIRVQGAEGTTELWDDGTHGDDHALNHLYTATWTPRVMGAYPPPVRGAGR